MQALLRDQIRYLRYDVELSEATFGSGGLNMTTPPGETFASQLQRVKLDAWKRDDFEVLDEIARRFAAGVRTERFKTDSGGVELTDAHGWTRPTAEAKRNNVRRYAAAVKEALKTRY